MRKYKTLKYVKHKKKFSKNRKPKRKSGYHNGGGIEPAKPLSSIIQLRNIYKDFFDKYFMIFIGSELLEYIITKYVPEFNVLINSSSIDIELIKSKLFIDELWNVIINDLINFFNILYTEMKQDVIDIHIFSVSTGTGFLEALFAIYLKIIREKTKVKIMFVDVIDYTSVLVDYKYQKAEGLHANVFDYVIGFLQKIGGKSAECINIIQLELIMNNAPKKQQLLIKFKDTEFEQIDIFIAVHARGIITHKFGGRTNSLVKLVNLYVNLLTKSEENQKRIPMLWLYYKASLDFKDKESLISSMQRINKYYINSIIEDYKHYKYKVAYDDKYIDIDAKTANYENYFNLSTLDNLWKIGMDEIQKYPIPTPVNILNDV